MQCVSNVNVFVENQYQVINEDDQRMKDIKQSSATNTLRKKTESIQSWSIRETFQCTIKAVISLNCDTTRTVEIGVQAGLFHGGKSLCEPKKTIERVMSVNNSSVTFNQVLNFDIQVLNIPRMARLCIVIYETAKSAKGGGFRGRRIKDSNKVENYNLKYVVKKFHKSFFNFSRNSIQIL